MKAGYCLNGRAKPLSKLQSVGQPYIAGSLLPHPRPHQHQHTHARKESVPPADAPCNARRLFCDTDHLIDAI
eukprot:354575-Chlamydomonas_euryale.AAC.9